MGERSSGSGFKAGAPTAAATAASTAAAPRISDFFQRQLNQISEEIRRQQLIARLPQDSAITRRKAQQAQRRIAQLEQQYDQIERRAREDAESGIGF